MRQRKFVTLPAWWIAHVVQTLEGELPSGRIGDAVFLLRDMLRDTLEGKEPMSALRDQFKRAAKVKPADSPGTKISVWEERGGYYASVSVFGGGVGGHGNTPEEAIDDAMRALVASRKS